MSRTPARVLALAALVAAVAAAAFVLLGDRGPGYAVRARFQNASQLAKGNFVQLAASRSGRSPAST